MCGIVGISGDSKAVDHVISGLQRLEYRGYDSAGVATLDDNGLSVCKSPGKLQNLVDLVQAAPFKSPLPCAIGHTRWATHGEPTQLNAHPHIVGDVAVVHNGIIENFQQLRSELAQSGVTFQSETDTETIPALLNHYLHNGHDLLGAATATIKRLDGAFAVAALVKSDPGTLLAMRRGAPLVVGLGEGANYIASDPMALAELTNKFIYLEEDDIAIVDAEKITIYRPDGSIALRQTHTLDLSGVMAGKGGYKHFMLKEIHEQPAVVAKILESYVKPDNTLNIPDMPFNFKDVPQINIVACGTAYYAGMVGKYYFEQLAGIPVNVDVASEFRYRQPPYLPGGVFIAVSQSGETADTLAALEDAKANGQHIITLTNTPTSSMARASDVVLNLHAGPEIAVASTKAFTAMVLVLCLFALRAAKQTTPEHDRAGYLQSLRELPAKLEQTLTLDSQIQVLAKSLSSQTTSMLYLGRGMLQPLAYEGALKMKEISYIHAEAYASGEMKHGPIALVDENLPVINLAVSSDPIFEKTVSNMKEVEARRGQVILFTDQAGKDKLDSDIAKKAQTILLPQVPPLTAPLVFSVPLQLLSYHVAIQKGTDVDQPRNLAKSVTVE